MVDPLLARYLRGQLELGGPEVVLSHPLDVDAVQPDLASAAPVVSRPEKGGISPSPSPSAYSRSSEPLPRWKKDAPPIPGPGMQIGDGALPAPGWRSLDDIAAKIAGCFNCALARGRTNTVPGEGNPVARLMLIGEGPGATEDETGRPFVGRAGELLNGILTSIDLSREEVFIANVVKCRPPENRKPLPDEMAACQNFLMSQIALVAPKVILALGGTAAEALLGTKRSLGTLRGSVHSYYGVPLVVTYHPAALLRNPQWKKPTWDDVRIARQLLDR